MTVTRVYVARIAGLSVFDPNGDLMGRVRDAVARYRQDTRPPRTVGLIAEVPLRRRIFLPIGRVVSIDADAVVLNTGTLNLRRFAKRPGEVLVLEELLDRQVSIVETGVPAVVVDVAMEVDRAGDWTLSRLAVRAAPRAARGPAAKLGTASQLGTTTQHGTANRLGTTPRLGTATRLGRRGQLQELDWAEVSGLSGDPAVQGTASLLAVLEDLRPADLANVLQDLSRTRRNEVAAALDDDRLADVLEELPEHDQVDILAALDRERAADVLEEMDPDDAADLLAELPEPEQQELLGLMEPGEASSVQALMRYQPGTAGSVMTSEPVILTPDATVAEALARVRQPQLAPAVAAQVFVARAPMATPTGRYLGVVHFQRLLREPPAELVGGIVDSDIDPLDPDTPLPEVTRRMATYNLVALAVVDAGDRLVGAVTVDDLLDHLLPRHWRDRDRGQAAPAVQVRAGGPVRAAHQQDQDPTGTPGATRQPRRAGHG